MSALKPTRLLPGSGKRTKTMASIASNLVTKKNVFPTSTASLSETLWMIKLWLACRTTVGQTLSDAGRRQVKALVHDHSQTPGGPRMAHLI